MARKRDLEGAAGPAAQPAKRVRRFASEEMMDNDRPSPTPSPMPSPTPDVVHGKGKGRATDRHPHGGAMSTPKGKTRTTAATPKSTARPKARTAAELKEKNFLAAAQKSAESVQREAERQLQTRGTTFVPIDPSNGVYISKAHGSCRTVCGDGFGIIAVMRFCTKPQLCSFINFHFDLFMELYHAKKKVISTS